MRSRTEDVSGLQMRHYIGTMRTLLATLTLLLLSPMSEGAAEAYGQDFVMLSDLADRYEVPTDDVSAPPEQLRQDLQQLEARLEQQLTAAGPYGLARAETLGDMARLLEQLGRAREALELRERALHLVRVNEGLYSPGQGPLVREILSSLRRSGDMLALDDRYNYFFRLYGSGRPPWNEVRWNALLEYVDWQREALSIELDGDDPRDRLLDLYELLEEVHEALLVSAPEALDWQRLATVVHIRLTVFYVLEDLIEPEQDFRSLRGEIVRVDEPGEFDLRQERLENLHRSLKSRGRRIVEEALELIPKHAGRERLELELALADWLQWYGTTREAGARYLEIWRKLGESGDDETRQKWFDGPRPLPANGAFRSAGEPSVPVSLRVTVSTTGRGRGYAESVPEEQKRAVGRLNSYIASTKFRPRIVNGEIVEGDYANTSWILLYR